MTTWTYEHQEDLDSEGNGYVWAIQVEGVNEPGFAASDIKSDAYQQNPAYANSKDHARLIAAAPDLLAALEHAANLIADCQREGCPTGPVAIPSQITAAIAKARNLE